jgi:hypothetical protein
MQPLSLLTVKLKRFPKIPFIAWHSRPASDGPGHPELCRDRAKMAQLEPECGPGLGRRGDYFFRRKKALGAVTGLETEFWKPVSVERLVTASQLAPARLVLVCN